MKTLMELKNIHKSFDKTEVLSGINLTIKEGEILSVLGPSGCGKSTLLKIIAGILPLDDGCVMIDETIVSSKKNVLPTEKRNINMVFQNFALWPHMTVKQNILFGLKIKKIDAQEMDERMEELIELLHLEGLINRYPAELSGGQQQRVAIARALITKPKIVLLDEPLCNLDIQLRIEMRTEMSYLFRKLGTTVFHVTHDPSEAFAMADKIVIMNNGVIEQMSIPMECYRNPQTQMVAGLLGASNKIKGGNIKDKQKDDASISVGEAVLEARTFLVSGNRDITLRFRPEACQFHDEYVSNSLPVKVVLSTFEGSCYRVRVEASNGAQFCILEKDSLKEGVSGFVSIDKTQLYAYDV